MTCAPGTTHDFSIILVESASDLRSIGSCHVCICICSLSRRALSNSISLSLAPASVGDGSSTGRGFLFALTNPSHRTPPL